MPSASCPGDKEVFSLKSRNVRSILSISLSILLLAGVIGSSCACRKRPADTTPDAATVAQKQIRDSLDDFFAYVKMTRTDKMYAFSENPSTAEDIVTELIEVSGEDVFELVSSRVELNIVEVTANASGDSGKAHIQITCCDGAAVIEKSDEDGGFANARACKDAISSAQTKTEEMEISMVKGEKWTIAESDMVKILETIYGFLRTPMYQAVPQETSHDDQPLVIDVYDSYWVDTKGSETGGYHCSDSKICLYVYTWNTYSNVEIRYEFLDGSGNVFYSNTFSMTKNTDWIACSWRPDQPLPDGVLYCKLYEPTGVVFHKAQIRIWPDGAKLPFPITWMSTSYWADETGANVDFYPADTEILEYHALALKFYKDLSLHYRFLDEDGKVLYESDLYIDESTDTFVFTWNRGGEDPLIAEETQAMESQRLEDPQGSETTASQDIAASDSGETTVADPGETKTLIPVRPQLPIQVWPRPPTPIRHRPPTRRLLPRPRNRRQRRSHLK